MAEQEKAPKASKAEKRQGPGFAWVVVDDGKNVLAVERSENRALWLAVEAKANVVKWPFGKLRAEVLG